MSIDPTALANLLTLRKPAVAAYWKVVWDPDDAAQTRYYSDSMYQQLAPFMNIGVNIEARILESVVENTQFEINPDLKAESIPLTFDDIDREISGKFQTFKSGINCELIFYYPNPGSTPISDPVWFGQLQAPEIYGHKTVKTKATNGFRSREQLVPKRMRPRECTANFGGMLPSTFAIETNGCPYDRHLGGSMGTLNPANGLPWTDCPRDTKATCDTRLGTTDGKYFLGFDTDASATVTDASSGYIAVSKGNQSALKTPIRVIAGNKYIRGLQLLLWRREVNSSTPAHGFVAGVWEVGEGPIFHMGITAIKIKETVIAQMHIVLRDGDLGQWTNGYASTMSNFSGTANFFARYGWVNPLDIGVGDLEAECRVIGFREVAVFTDAVTYSRTWTDNRIWWLMELYSNQRWGMAYPSSRFTIDDWIDVAAWSDNSVTFAAMFLDGEVKTYAGRRSTFDCALEGRAVAEQVEDICRSGAVSVPFQHEGSFTLRPFTVATDDEWDDARTFTDTGTGKNIIWGDGQPAITLAQTPDDKIVNEVIVTFEEGSNYDVERPITVDDPTQKLKAGRVLGDNNLQSVPKRYAGFGIRAEQEAVRLAYRLLRFGQFDEGGTQNNLKATFTTPFEQTLGLKRYDLIKIESTLLDGFEIGTGDWVEDPLYFRVLKMKKIANGLVEITAQAYNDGAYLDFEIVTDEDPPGNQVCSIDADCEAGFICVGGRCIPEPPPDPCLLTFGVVEYDAENGLLNISIPPC